MNLNDLSKEQRQFLQRVAADAVNNPQVRAAAQTGDKQHFAEVLAALLPDLISARLNHENEMLIALSGSVTSDTRLSPEFREFKQGLSNFMYHELRDEAQPAPAPKIVRMHDHCPGCDHDHAEELQRGLFRCVKCAALYGACTRAEAEQYVRISNLVDGDFDGARYFDLMVRRSNATMSHRIHGWYDPASRNVLQYG